MLRAFKCLTSLDNFRRSGRPSGQIATLLILITVMLLIFVMVTLNIGQTSLNATLIANAADDGALYLGSQLATKARQLYDSLGQKEKYCVATGWASMILAIIIAIIVIVIVIMSCGAASPLLWAASHLILLMVVGAAAGAAGGAIGGAIAGTGAARGALQGAAVGAAIGGIASGIGSVAAIGSAGVGVGAAGGSTGLAAGGVGGLSAPLFVTTGTVFGASMITLGALSLGAAGYNQYTYDQVTNEAIDQYVTNLSQAPEKIRMREMTFLRTITQLVDDPNVVQDVYDVNNNGDQFDFVSEFEQLLVQRSRHIRDASVAARAQIEAIVNDSLMTWLPGAIETLKSFIDQDPPVDSGLKPWGAAMEVADYRIQLRGDTLTISDNAGHDGILAMGFRSFYNTPNLPGPARRLNQDPANPVFLPGPTPAAYQNYVTQMRACLETQTCDSTDVDADNPDGRNYSLGSLPAGFDQADAIQAQLRDIISWMEMLRDLDPQERASTYETWLGYFYDENDDPPDDVNGTAKEAMYASNDVSPASLFGELWKCAERIRFWGDRMVTLHRELPACVTDDPPTHYTNAPCQMVDEWGNRLIFADMSNTFWYYWWFLHREEALTYYMVSFDEVFGDEFFQFWTTFRRFGGMQGPIAQNEVVDELGHPAVNITLKRGVLREIAARFKEMSTAIYGWEDDGTLESRIEAELEGTLTGVNPIRYNWTDSRGTHRVMVQTGRFQVPRTKKYKTGNWFKGKSCIKLDRHNDTHEDQYTNTRNQCWVEVSRWDGASTLGVLGTFNPLMYGTNKRRSYYYFNYGNSGGGVGLKTRRTW